MNILRGIAAIAVMLSLAVPASAAKQDFLLVNDTGVTIEQLYVSTVKIDDWQEDIFGDGVLPDGNEVVVTFPVDQSHCKWDLKIVDSDGDEIVWGNLDLCNNSKITLHWENGKATASLE